MKKLLLVLLFVPLVSFGQSYEDGYKKGYKEGYCYEDKFCMPPLSPLTPLPMLGFDTYKDGYQKGFLDGKAEKEGKIEVKPNVKSQYVSTNNEWKKFQDEITQGVNAKVGTRVFDEVILPLKVDLNAFKYLVLDFEQGRKSWLVRSNMKQLKEKLTSYDYDVINLANKKIKNNDPIPVDLKLDPSIALYLTLKFYPARLYVSDSEKNTVHIKAVQGLIYAKTLYDRLASELISHKYNYDPNTPKYLSSQVPEMKTSAKEDAVKRLKEAKDLFDSGILTKEEYDKLVAKYKPIIMGN